MTFRVRIFGHVRLTDDGDELSLSPLQVALVALVYGSGSSGVSRRSAARLLWGVRAGGRGRRLLRQLIYELKCRIQGTIIDASTDLLRPHAGVRCDVQRLEEALNRNAMSEAARLVIRGFARTDVEVPEAFDDWRRGRERRLKEDLRARAAARWRSAVHSGRRSEARDAAEALYALDRTDPRAVRGVVESRARDGAFDAADEAFAQYVAALPNGSAPDNDVVCAIDRARLLAARPWARESSPASEGPFVGRRNALLVSRRAIDSVESGSFELVLVSGESGIGKTRLLDEVRRDATMQGLRCLRAQPVELERNIPLNPLLDALCDVDLDPHLRALGRPWSSVIESLLPHGAIARPGEEPPPIRTSSLSRRLLESFSLLLERLARETPTLLIIDDLQWADATTVTALQFLQRRWSHGSLGIFASVRPELIGPDDPVAKYLTTTNGLEVQHIELPVLALPEALELVASVGENRIGAAKAERICDIAGCHPLYLTELTRDYLSGRLTLPERPSDEVPIPTSLAQMLDARLESLDDATMRVAGVLAVAGKPLRIPEIASLVDLGPAETTFAVDDLTKARFTIAEADRVRIVHELFRSAVYRHLSGPHRALYHRAIAERLVKASSGSEDEPSGELALHYARAGEDRLAARYGWAAARQALDSGALAEAAHFLQIVVENESQPTVLVEATAELAKALHLLRNITLANPQLRVAATQLRDTGQPHLARRLDVKRVEGLADVGAAAVPELLNTLGTIKAEARAERDWESIALALDVELHLLDRAGDIEGIPRVLRQMKEAAETGSLEAQLLGSAGLALGVFFDCPQEALAAAQRAIALSEDQRPDYRLKALVRLMVVLHASGKLTLPESSSFVEEAQRLARLSGNALQRYAIESNIAVAFLDAGELDRAEVLMARADSESVAGEMDNQRFIRANNRAELALARQDFEAAGSEFRAASDFLGATSPAFMQDLVHAGLGYCALQTGNLQEAGNRQDLLRSAPRSWHFDPTTLLTFQSRLMEVRGDWRDAIGLIECAADDVRDRLVLAWFKLRLLQARLMRKYDQNPAEIVKEAQERAERLGLQHRAHEFARMLA